MLKGGSMGCIEKIAAAGVGFKLSISIRVLSNKADRSFEWIGGYNFIVTGVKAEV